MERNPYKPTEASVADLNGPKVDRPEQVTKAVGLLWLTLALGLIGSALQWQYLTSLSGVGFALYVQVVTFAVLAWLIHKLSRGRNWARITFLILFIIGLAPGLMQLSATMGRSPIAAVIGGLQFALQAWALYLTFSEPGRRWFRKPESVVPAI